MAYLIFNTIFEFLEQFTIRCICYCSRRCWLFWDRAQNMLIFGRRCSNPLRETGINLPHRSNTLFRHPAPHISDGSPEHAISHSESETLPYLSYATPSLPQKHTRLNCKPIYLLPWGMQWEMQEASVRESESKRWSGTALSWLSI